MRTYYLEWLCPICKLRHAIKPTHVAGFLALECPNMKPGEIKFTVTTKPPTSSPTPPTPDPAALR